MRRRGWRSKVQHVTIHGSAARTASFDTSPQELNDSIQQLAVHLDITAVSGTSPSMTLTVQDSPDGSVWANHTAFAAKTAVGQDVLRLDKLSRYVRAKVAISGTTPSFTFSLQAVGR